MSFFGSLFGSDAKEAAERAAQDTYAKQQSATRDYLAFGDTLPGSYAKLAEGFKPYVEAGGSALNRLLAGLGLGDGGEDFTAAYRALPGYEAGRTAGLTATERALNAGNIGQSGAALKALYRFGSDYEDQRAGDYFSRLMGLTGMGQQATGAQIGTQATGLAGQQNVRQSAYGGQMQSAPTIGQGMVAGAQAEQDALTNLLGIAGYLGGQFLGGPGGKVAATKLFG